MGRCAGFFRELGIFVEFALARAATPRAGSVSLATTRFFRKCFATAQAGHTVILIGGFRDKPSNRKIRNRLSRISAAAHHHADILLTFPSNTFPAGTVRGWPESPDDDHHQHNQFSLHERFGVPTQPTKMNPNIVNRHVI